MCVWRWDIILKIYNGRDVGAWDACVRSFADWDIYYLYGYVRSLMLHGDGNPLLLYLEDGKDRVCYVVMQRDIATCERFSGVLENGRYLDWETPYGYGGPLTDGEIAGESQQLFKEELYAYCRGHGIVSQFVRFHPLLGNHKVLSGMIEACYLRDTIFMDTSDPERIMEEMDSKNRNMVRKAQRCGVTTVVRGIEDYADLIVMYNETMKKNGAEDYYTFAEDYFRSLAEMERNALIMYAMYEGHPISGAIMLYNDRYMHYHLAGSDIDFRKYSPNNLLLYDAACWAGRHGIKKFHLGGGMAPDDSLFGFKKQFNKNGRIPFWVGRTIFDHRAYEGLLKTRKELDPDFDSNNGYMIQYRR